MKKVNFEHSTVWLSVTPEGNVPSQVITPDVLCIEKGWGRKEDKLGEYFAYHGHEHPIPVETVKILYFARDKRLSRHYHVKKSEYFVLIKGALQIEIWTGDGTRHAFIMNELDRIFIKPGCQHRMTGLEEENILLEISTIDTPNDSYRIEKGD